MYQQHGNWIQTALTIFTWIVPASLAGGILMGLLTAISGWMEKAPYTIRIPAVLLSFGCGLLAFNQFQKLRRVNQDALLTVVPKYPSRCTWGIGTADNQPCIHVFSDFYLTNPPSSSQACVITNTFLVVYYFVWKIIPAYKKVEGINTHDHPIQPGQVVEGRAMWFIVPPIREKGKPLYGRAIFVDQYGREYRSRVLRWNFEG
jgi:hypothetical protein